METQRSRLLFQTCWEYGRSIGKSVFLFSVLYPGGNILVVTCISQNLVRVQIGSHYQESQYDEIFSQGYDREVILRSISQIGHERSAKSVRKTRERSVGVIRSPTLCGRGIRTQPDHTSLDFRKRQ